MKPPHLACGWPGRKRVQHRQYWSYSDSGANQNDRPVGWLQNEAPPWGAHLQNVADSDFGAQIVAGRTLIFLFDAQAIVLSAWRAGERVTAQQRGLLRLGTQAYDNELSWQGNRKRPAIGWDQFQ
jgi:hypothetical protein